MTPERLLSIVLLTIIFGIGGLFVLGCFVGMMSG